MTEYISLLVQVPLVGAVIWYSLEMVKRFTESLQKRDEFYEARNRALVSAIAALTDNIADMNCKNIEQHASLSSSHAELVAAIETLHLTSRKMKTTGRSNNQ